MPRDEANTKFILEELYEGLVKLETDLTHDHVVEEFLNIQGVADSDRAILIHQALTGEAKSQVFDFTNNPE